MARRLRRLFFDRVDLVDAGANPGANITLFKREKVRPGKVGTLPPVESETSKEKTLPSLLKREKSEEVEEQDADELRAEVEKLRKQLDERDEKPDFTSAGERDLEIEELRKQAKRREQEVEELRKEKRIREFVKQASEFDTVAEPTSLGGLLEEADRVLSEENVELMSKILVAARAASEQEHTSKLFSQLTKTESEVAEDPKETLEKAAKARASEKNITIEQATTEVISEDAELRKAYYEAKESE